MLETDEALGFRFVRGRDEQILAMIFELSRLPYSYMITPNVDFVVRAYKDKGARLLYDKASVHICDSRVVRMCMRLLGVSLSCFPGSDVVRCLFESGRSDVGFLVAGPTEQQFIRLTHKFPNLRLQFLPTPANFGRHDPRWAAALVDAAEATWDVILICFGSPKQEQFAFDLARLRQAPGVALCVGGSIDFLTGAQVRSPAWMQRLSLEWLFRLLTNPRRLWRRYLVDNPKFFLILLQEAYGRYSKKGSRN